MYTPTVSKSSRPEKVRERDMHFWSLPLLLAALDVPRKMTIRAGCGGWIKKAAAAIVSRPQRCLAEAAKMFRTLHWRLLVYIFGAVRSRRRAGAGCSSAGRQGCKGAVSTVDEN